MNISLFTLIYALLVIAGGIIGYLTAKSRASLIAGLASGAVLLLAWYLFSISFTLALIIGLVVAAALTVVFVRRYQATRKIMPSGMMAGLSALMTILYVVSFFLGTNTTAIVWQ